MKSIQYVMPSKIGPLYLVASEVGLRGVFWKKQNAVCIKSLRGSAPELQFLRQAVEQISEYLHGKRKDFDLSLDIEGTEFQKQVWRQLLHIPYGKTVSYQDIARKIKNDKAFRAVGTANGKNPLSIIIPCHRVIATNGTLAGYAGGLQMKTRLLQLESAHSQAR